MKRKAIAGDIEANEEKINHHGKRADAIVKGMLQHSQEAAPAKKNLPISMRWRMNTCGWLIMELRAKDKTFNAKFETDFDQTIGTINVVPQEIGRVILNLINNAFYAVTEKQKQDSEPTYEPTGFGKHKKVALIK